ncbi:MAG: histidine phosphatase family protein [Bacillota bacterium]
MEERTLLFLARHGQTSFNQEGRIQGQTDVPLDEEGLRQAQALASFARRAGISVVYASDLQRALNTARACAESCGLLVHARRDLRERDFGDLEGKTPAELGQSLSEFMTYSREQEDLPLPGGGESYRQLRERAVQALTSMVSTHPAQRVLVVSHGALLKSALEWALGLPPGVRGRFLLANASVSRVEFSRGRPLVLALNDTCHLDSF